MKALFTWLKSDIFPDNHRMMRLAAALGCVVISCSIGLAYGTLVYIQGWQLWGWLISVICLCLILLPSIHVKIDRTWWLLLIILVVALGLRVYDLEHIPGGLHVDEVGTAGFTIDQIYRIPNATLNPFVTGPVSQPALYYYLVWVMLYVFGPSITALRLWSAIAGSLAILATFYLVSTVANKRLAMLASLLMVTYHYHVHWSRIALNNIWDTLWVPLSLAAFAWGWKHKWSGGAVISGLTIGLAQYFYGGAKLGVFLLIYIFFALRKEFPVDWRQSMIYVGKFLVTAIGVAAPILCFILLQPSIYLERPYTAFGWRPEYIQSVMGENYSLLEYIWYQLSHSLGAFIVYPDVTGFDGPGIPFTVGIAAVLFITGFIWALFRRDWLPIIWILLTSLLGGFLLGGSPSSSHYVVSIPAICWLEAIPLAWLFERGRGWLALLLLLAVMCFDLYFYFGVYIPSVPRDLNLQFPGF